MMLSRIFSLLKRLKLQRSKGKETGIWQWGLCWWLRGWGVIVRWMPIGRFLVQYCVGGEVGREKKMQKGEKYR
jgi:hypothetical protein